MKTIALFLLSSLCLWAGEFQNLNFEAGNLANVQPQAGRLLGPAAELLPGWKVQYDGVAVDEVYYSPQGGSGFCCGVALREMADHLQPFYGQFGVIVDPVRLGSGGELVGIPMTLSQVGRVPDDAQFLQFKHPFYTPEVRINGQLTVWGRHPEAAAVDVRSFAGQEIDLSFTFLPEQGELFEIYGFSVVPEPETWALLGVGLATLLWWQRRR